VDNGNSKFRIFLNTEIIDKYVKKINKLKKNVNQNVNLIIDKDNKSVIIIKKNNVNAYNKIVNVKKINDLFYISIKNLEKKIKIIIRDYELQSTHNLKKRIKTNKYKKELIRYNKKKFKYWYLVNYS
jgi:hypothetical protein